MKKEKNTSIWDVLKKQTKVHTIVIDPIGKSVTISLVHEYLDDETIVHELTKFETKVEQFENTKELFDLLKNYVS